MGLHELDTSTQPRHCWLLAGAVTLVCVALEAAGLRDLLAYDRAGLGAGQVWRLLTAHFVHLGWTHMLLNLAGPVVVNARNRRGVQAILDRGGWSTQERVPRK